MNQKYFEVLMFLVALVFVVALGGIALNSEIKTEDIRRSEYCKNKTVVETGGCRGSGLCGVKWSDGTFGRMFTPTVGQKCK